MTWYIEYKKGKMVCIMELSDDQYTNYRKMDQDGKKKFIRKIENHIKKMEKF